MNNLNMYVSTCDATMRFVPIFSYFYEKYWTSPNKLKFLGFKPLDYRLPERIEYISLAEKQEGGVNNWSTYLVDYFEKLDDEFILWGIDDHLITDTIDSKLLEFLYDKIKTDNTVGRINLVESLEFRNCDVLEHHGDFDLLSQKRGTNYRIDCQFSIWRMSYLLNRLKRNWTPWQFEVYGSDLARNDEFKILGTGKKQVVHKVEAKRNFEPDFVNLLGIKYKDIFELIKLGLVDKSEIIGRMDWLWIDKA